MIATNSVSTTNYKKNSSAFEDPLNEYTLYYWWFPNGLDPKTNSLLRSDKICDQISDAILDACLEQDPHSRVACETATKTGIIILLGEISTRAIINYQDIVRKTICRIGYDHCEKGKATISQRGSTRP